MTEPWQTDKQSGCIAQNSQEYLNPYHDTEELKTNINDRSDTRNCPKYWEIGEEGISILKQILICNA